MLEDPKWIPTPLVMKLDYPTTIMSDLARLEMSLLMGGSEKEKYIPGSGSFVVSIYDVMVAKVLCGRSDLRAIAEDHFGKPLFDCEFDAWCKKIGKV